MLWPVTITVIVVLAIVLAAVTDGTGSPLYAEDLREQAVVLSRKAGVFQDVLARIGNVDRVELVTVVDEIEAAVADAHGFLDSVESPPEGATAPAVLFELALDSWEQGAVELERALLAAADGDFTVRSEDVAVNALLELRAGDRLYAESVRRLAESDVTPPVSPMPAIEFLPAGYPLVAGASTLVATARLDGSPLELRAELRISNMTTDPAWVVDTEGSVTVEFTETIAFKVVVSNDGNTRSDPSEVTIEIVGGDGSNQAFTQPTERLEPGVSTTVSFAGIPVSPGVAYQVAARLPLAEGEVETADNARSQRFTVNEPTPTTTTTTEAASGGDS